MSQDPWKHRSKGMKCRTCMWFVVKEPDDKGKEAIAAAAEADPSAGPPPLVGRCRRHSPTMNGYPAVFTDDWCGDHKLDETKLST